MIRGQLPKQGITPVGSEEDCIEYLRGQGWRPRKKIFMSGWDLIKMLGFPEGWMPLKVYTHGDPDGFGVVIEADEFELVDPAVESEIIEHWWTREQMTDDQGRVWVRAKYLEKDREG